MRSVNKSVNESAHKCTNKRTNKRTNKCADKEPSLTSAQQALIDEAPRAKKLLAKAWLNPSPIEAIRAKCIDCSVFDLEAALNCEITSCPLWEIRKSALQGVRRKRCSCLTERFFLSPHWPRLRGVFFWRMLCLVFCKSIAMPSKSAKQARLMAAAAHDPEFAKKVGIPVSVAKEFNKADAKTGILRKRKKK